MADMSRHLSILAYHVDIDFRTMTPMPPNPDDDDAPLPSPSAYDGNRPTNERQWATGGHHPDTPRCMSDGRRSMVHALCEQMHDMVSRLQMYMCWGLRVRSACSCVADAQHALHIVEFWS